MHRECKHPENIYLQKAFTRFQVPQPCRTCIWSGATSATLCIVVLFFFFLRQDPIVPCVWTEPNTEGPTPWRIQQLHTTIPHGYILTDIHPRREQNNPLPPQKKQQGFISKEKRYIVQPKQTLRLRPPSGPQTTNTLFSWLGWRHIPAWALP